MDKTPTFFQCHFLRISSELLRRASAIARRGVHTARKPEAAFYGEKIIRSSGAVCLLKLVWNAPALN